MTIQIFKSKKWRMTVAGMLICMFGLAVLPSFGLLTDSQYFNAFFGGLLLGIGFTLTMLTVTNAKDIQDETLKGQASEE